MLNERENILSALREKPLKVYEIMKRVNIFWCSVALSSSAVHDERNHPMPLVDERERAVAKCCKREVSFVPSVPCYITAAIKVTVMAAGDRLLRR